MMALVAAWACSATAPVASAPGPNGETAAGAAQRPNAAPPAPQPASRPAQQAKSTQSATAERLQRVSGVRSFAYQLANLDLAAAERSPFDMIIIDAASGIKDGQRLKKADIERLKRKPDGGRRLVLSYLSVGEAEDYRPDYFSQEYLTEEAPDWLLSENPQWKGNRLIRFCNEGWQRTVLGDEDGRSLYNSIEPAPLQRLIELGFDGVALDRVDVYAEVGKECPNAKQRMVEFVARLARHARRSQPGFLLLLHNAEELIQQKPLLEAIDAVVKEDLFYGVPTAQRPNTETYIREALAHLNAARSAGRAVMVIDYLTDRALIAADRRRIEGHGFVAYFGPKKLDTLWLPGVNF